MEVFFLGWFFAAALIALWANSRGRSGLGFALVSLIFSPLLAAIILLVTKDLKQEAEQRAERERDEARRDQERREEHEKQLAALRVMAERPSSTPPAQHSVADELAKLGDLLSKGILTEDEFKEQKAALLRRS